MSTESVARARLSKADFEVVRAVVCRAAGLGFGDDARGLFERKLRERLVALELEDFSRYARYLQSHARARLEIAEAVDVLSTHETYFFRERYQLDAFNDEVLKVLALEQRRRRSMVVWSAGCASGEEAYTLAILLRESRRLAGWDLRVLGTDVSRRMVRAAKRGVYGPTSFRAMPPGYDRHFRDGRGGREVVEETKALCQFGFGNLIDPARAGVVTQVDVIFCRNVLIYFEAEARRRALDLLFSRLRPGGYLMLGHSESLVHGDTPFEAERVDRDIVYRRHS